MLGAGPRLGSEGSEAGGSLTAEHELQPACVLKETASVYCPFPVCSM